MDSIFGDEENGDHYNDTIGDDRLPSDNEQASDNNEHAHLFIDEDGMNDAEGDGVNSSQQATTVEPKKRVRNPRLRLTIDTLCGQRGVQSVENFFEDIKFRGKTHEKDDLDEVLRRLQHWSHRMYPTSKFGDLLIHIERLGKKKALQVHMSRYRLGLLESAKLYEEEDEQVNDVNYDSSNGVADEPYDEFDALLGKQIAISKLDPRTPSANRHNPNLMMSSSLTTPSFTRNIAMSTPFTVGEQGANSKTVNCNFNDTNDYAQALPPSQPPTPTTKRLTSDQLARIAENRRMAQERLRDNQQKSKNKVLNS